MTTDRALLEAAAIIMPGEFANYCGQRWKVGAVGFTGGERYYWLTRGGGVAMVPATMVEPAAPKEKTHE